MIAVAIWAAILAVADAPYYYLPTSEDRLSGIGQDLTPRSCERLGSRHLSAAVCLDESWTLPNLIGILPVKSLEIW